MPIVPLGVFRKYNSAMPAGYTRTNGRQVLTATQLGLKTTVREYQTP